MKTPNSKINRGTALSVLTVVLILTFAVSLLSIPAATAHTPAWNIPTYAYIVATPDPVGVNQNTFIMMWLNWPPPTAAGSGGDRWQGYMLTITRPDGTTETKGPYTSDSTSSAFIQYTPTQTGTYTLKFDFPGQVASLYNPTNGQAGSNSAYIGDNFLASTATATLTVQAEQLEPIPSYPLPTTYWTRPIEGQNSNWDYVASNFLGTASGQIQGGGGFGGGGVQLDGIAPNSPHIMWTKPLQDGGVVGGQYSIGAGVTYYSGLSYQGRMGTTLIVNGRVYYDTPLSDDASKGPFMCIDLRTGETIWTNPSIAPTFGQLYDYESMNQHGVIPDGYLWQISGSTWIATDPRTSEWLFNLTGCPSGTPVAGPNGEVLRMVLNYNRTSNTGWLGLWNNTAAAGLAAGLTGSNAYQWRPLAGNRTIDASKAYSWNVSVSGLIGAANPQMLSVVYNDIIIGTSTSLPAFSAFGSPETLTFWAISLKPESRGQLLWIKNYQAPPGNLTVAYMGGPSSGSTNLQVDTKNRVWFMTNKETMQWWGYDLDTGNELWGPSGQFNDFQYYGTVSNPPAPGYVYDGIFYVAGYGGVLNAIESRTGRILWTYGNGGEGNSTNSGLDTPWGNYPTFIGAIADGKIYLYSSEHSPNTPPWKGEQVRCIDAKTGAEIWTMDGWPGMGGFGQLPIPIADGYMVYLNTYDNQIYCIGKGPSTTTVEAPLSGVTVGQSPVIQGKVIDVSAGAKAKVESGEFSIVPAMSDASMGNWMEYVYMQKPCPADATGVPVTIFATDENGNTQTLATVTSDGSGLYSYAWSPQTTGKYVITAVFEGSESYFSSSATTAVSIDAARPVTTQTPAPTATVAPTVTVAPTATIAPSPTVAPTPGTGLSTETLLIAGAAVVIIIAVIAAALVLRKRK